MALPDEPTLGALRAELRARLGFSATVATAVQTAILNSFLKRAQIELYWVMNQEDQRTQGATFNTVAGTSLYEWPAAVNPEKRWSIEILIDSLWLVLFPGIDREHDSVPDGGPPERWDYRERKIELWPVPDEIYTIRFEDFGRLGAFDADNDKATLKSEIFWPLALYEAKAHYRQPDAQEYLRQHTAIKNGFLKGQQRGRRYIRGRRRAIARDDPHGLVPPRRV